MLDYLDPILLARIQFAFTISFHIIFPAFTIGLASFLAITEWRWLATGKEVYRDIYKFWVKILVNPHFRVRVLSESSGHDVA